MPLLVDSPPRGAEVIPVRPYVHVLEPLEQQRERFRGVTEVIMRIRVDPDGEWDRGDQASSWPEHTKDLGERFVRGMEMLHDLTQHNPIERLTRKR